MATFFASLRKTLSKAISSGSNVVRRVGKGTRKTLKRVTNAVGITKKARKGRRQSKRNSQRN